MAKELAFVMINPYTLSKSRTGGVIARCVGRTDLDLVGARMFAPSEELINEYVELIRSHEQDSVVGQMIVDYVSKYYRPDAATGKPKRVMLLMFEGEDAVNKIWHIAGSSTKNMYSGLTIRDTYGDYILNDDGTVHYYEPAVLVAPTVKRAEATLRLWSKYSAECGGIVNAAVDVSGDSDTERTLVMLKPDNFRFPSLRAGNIIDILSRSGLRIIGAKKFTMTVPQAEEFYGPVVEALTDKFEMIGSARAASALSKEFGFDVSEDDTKELCRKLGFKFATAQFSNIVKFITGLTPAEYKSKLASSEANGEEFKFEGCLALVYEGKNAIKTIRDLLGPTDPSKAEPGSVRKEFGSDIMVNAAHASDSVENAQREMKIIDIAGDVITSLVEKHYGKK
ncbi:MAG: nucleoside-diphosphate kinase [Kiritimatiellae bacterium]|nr:nucleoside-diphosphate kinase [Kiritimatiellia bacterium]